MMIAMSGQIPMTSFTTDQGSPNLEPPSYCTSKDYLLEGRYLGYRVGKVLLTGSGVL